MAPYNSVMMKFLLLACLAFSALSTTAGSESRSAKNTNVASVVRLNKNRLHAGTEGEILITLTPNKGIHINLDPPLSIVLDSSDAISSVGNADVPKKDTVLDVSKPIRLSFSLSKKIKPGSVTIRGTVTYFYCSEIEGWCSKFRQPFEVKLTVVR